jgi:hypothetical protein
LLKVFFIAPAISLFFQIFNAALHRPFRVLRRIVAETGACAALQLQVISFPAHGKYHP